MPSFDTPIKKKNKSSVERTVSSKDIAPSEKKCNSRLIKKDGYCEKPGTGKGLRCHHHGGNKMSVEAKGLFQDALGLEQGLELEKFIKDTESMSGEIGIQKIELIEDIRKKKILQRRYEDLLLMDYPEPEPIESDADDIESEKTRYELELDGWKRMTKHHDKKVKDVTRAYEMVTKRIQGMLDQISKSVERNNKVIHGKKYTIDIKQLTEVMHIQVNILEEHCKGCSKLALVAKDFKDMKLRGIGSITEVSNMVGGNVPPEYKSMMTKMKKQNAEERLKKRVENADFEELD